MTLSRLLLALASLVGFAGASTTSSSTTTTTFTVTTYTMTTTTTTTNTMMGGTTTTTTVTDGPTFTTTTVTQGPTTTTTTVTQGPTTTVTQGPTPTVTQGAPTTTVTSNGATQAAVTTAAQGADDSSDTTMKKTKGVTATMGMTLNITDNSCPSIIAVASMGPMAACALINDVLAGMGNSNVKVCTKGQTIDNQATAVCIGSGDPNLNTFTGATPSSGTIVADDAFASCRYRCDARRRGLEQQSARGRHLTTATVTIKTAHEIRSKTALSTTALNNATAAFASSSTIQAAITAKVGQIKTAIELNQPLPGVPADTSGAAQTSLTFRTAAAGGGTALSIDAFNAASTGASIDSVAAATTTIVTPAAGPLPSGGTSATAGAATQSAMGALALAALGALVF